MKKAVFVCPPHSDELHVRVNAQAFRSMSGQLIDNLFDINGIDPMDAQLLFAPGARNRLRNDDKDESLTFRVGEERFVDSSQWNAEVDEEFQTYEKSQRDFSNQLYTDKDDFEHFPSYLGVKETNFKG